MVNPTPIPVTIIKRNLSVSQLPLKRTRTYQPKASILIAASIEKMSKDSLEVSDGIEEEELSELASVRFNPVTTVVQPDGIRQDSSLRKAGVDSPRGNVVDFHI